MPAKVSIITVVFNDHTHLERTILSIVHQSFQNFEYLVIDGGSTDGSLGILKRYKDHISCLISEPDKGIYDAMNKGLTRATGDYVLFMNSGDELFCSETLQSIFGNAPADVDVFYGETEMLSPDLLSLGQRRHKAPLCLNYQSFKYGMSVCHQAIFIKRELCELYKPNYQLSADIDWILTALKKSRKVVNTHQYVAKYLVGGMSKSKHWQSLKERFWIMSHHYGFFQTIMNHFVILSNLIFYYLKNRRTND